MTARPGRTVGCLLCAAVSLAFRPGAPRADGIFTDTGDDIAGAGRTQLLVSGGLRLRGELFDNLDLDRGPTPSGQLLFPVPLADPSGQVLTNADMRLRTDIAFYAPDTATAVRVRLDVLDNTELGGTPAGVPYASTTQVSPARAIRVERAYGETVTPLGVLFAGRMGFQWGLGMVANAGDCPDCDSADSVDGAAFVTSIAGHFWALAYGLSGSGPFEPRKPGTSVIDLDPSDDVRSVTFAFLRWKDDLSRKRRRGAGLWTVEYGAYGAYRWQDNDVPAWYLSSTVPAGFTPSQVMSRGFHATAVDGWLRVTAPAARIEVEGAWLTAEVAQPSLLPGVLLRQPLESSQVGVAVQSDVGAPESRFGAGLDAGYASGDPAPGFGAFPTSQSPPRPGDLDGPQANPPYDNRVDNFRFHPDFRIDQILFREILGTVTDALYVRPHAVWRIVQLPAASLRAETAVIASRAVYASSTPGGAAPLGVEIDPSLVYASRSSFALALEYGVLFPLAGLDNPALHLKAQPGQMARLRVIFAF